MSTRRNDGPGSPSDLAWFRKHDPENAAIRHEAAVVASRLDEVLSEPLNAKATLEAALVAAMEHEVEQARNEACFWQREANAERLKRETAESMAAEFEAKVKLGARITLASVVLLVLWLMVRYG